MNDEALAQAATLIAQAGGLIVEIGAGTAVPSVRQFSQQVAARYGGRILRFNRRERAVATAFGIGLAGDALETLTALEKRLTAWPS